MSLLGRRRVVKVSLEATKGTAVAGATALLCYEPTIKPDDNALQREPAGTYGGQALAASGPRTGKASIRTELRSDLLYGLETGIEAMLQAGGMKLTAEALAPVTAIASQKTITIDFWRDGLKERLYGAMCDWELSGEFGKQVFFQGDFSGIYSRLDDEAMPAVSHSAAKPMLAKAVTITVGLYSVQMSKFSIKPNNPVEAREDISATEGVAHYIIGPNRRYVIALDPEVVASASWDPRALWAAETEAAFSLLLSDGSVDVLIEAPLCQYMAPQEGARDSKMIYDLSLQCNTNAGDDELTITPS